MNAKEHWTDDVLVTLTSGTQHRIAIGQTIADGLLEYNEPEGPVDCIDLTRQAITGQTYLLTTAGTMIVVYGMGHVAAIESQRKDH